MGNPTFWCCQTQTDQPVDSVSDAAIRVADGRAEAFHILLAGVVVNRVALPDLGVFVWPNGIEIDYRMGRQWGPPEVVAFFDLLRDCWADDPATLINPSLGDGPPHPDRFRAAWSLHLTNSSR